MGNCLKRRRNRFVLNFWRNDMVRILRMISLVVVAATCAAAILVSVFGFGPPSEIQKKLLQASIVEEFKNKIGSLAQKDDTESPLVVQARIFALRIDPPPPKIVPLPQEPRTEPQPLVNRHDLVAELPIVPSELKLIGTASYTNCPEKSLALLNLVSGGSKWVRQGEIIDQTTVGEIKDGKVILYQNGKDEKQLFVPKPQDPLKPLLKNQG
jgi:hypothetical protein